MIRRPPISTRPDQLFPYTTLFRSCIDRNVRVSIPASVGERLRVQSAGGAVYLRADESIEPTRLQLQDADTGELILLDIAAHPANDGEPALEPVRIVTGSYTPQSYGQQVERKRVE